MTEHRTQPLHHLKPPPGGYLHHVHTDPLTPDTAYTVRRCAFWNTHSESLRIMTA